MGCDNKGIYIDIVSDCTTAKTGGIEVVGWGFYRSDLSPVYHATIKNLVTSMTIAATKSGFYIKGVKKSLNSKHSIVTSEDRPDKYVHSFMLQGFEVSAAAVANMDKLEDIVVVYERKHKPSGGDGVFVIRGLTHGLYKTSDSKEENAADAARMIELTSPGGEEEEYSEFIYLQTDVATTRAALNAMMTPTT